MFESHHNQPRYGAADGYQSTDLVGSHRSDSLNSLQIIERHEEVPEYKGLKHTISELGKLHEKKNS